MGLAGCSDLQREINLLTIGSLHFRDYVICPKEIIGIDLDKRLYHKIWHGCGWMGPRHRCLDEKCPVCGMAVENLLIHKRQMRNIKQRFPYTFWRGLYTEEIRQAISGLED